MTESFIAANTYTRRGCRLPERGRIVGGLPAVEEGYDHGALARAVLRAVRESPGIAAMALAAQLGTDVNVTSGVLRRLAEQGALERFGRYGRQYRAVEG